MFLIKKKKKHEGKFIGRQMIARNGFISTGKTARLYPKMLAILTTEQYIIRDFYNLIYVSLKKKTIFKAFSVHSKIERKVQRLPIHRAPAPMHAELPSLPTAISDTFAVTDEPT